MDHPRHSTGEWQSRTAMDRLMRAPASWSQSGEHSQNLKELSEQTEPWANLQTYIAALQSTDMIVQNEALKSLAELLLCVAPNTHSHFSCPDRYTIWIYLGSKTVKFKLQDVSHLHGLLFAELAQCSHFLFGDFSMGTKKSEMETAFPSKGLEADSQGHRQLDKVMKILRCCIRILPLIEFDTCLSHFAVETLAAVLQKVMSPMNINKLTAHGLNGNEGYSDSQPIDKQFSLSTLWSSAEVACLEDLLKQKRAHEGGGFMTMSTQCLKFANTRSDRYHNHDLGTPANICLLVCALLEVYIDEMMLQPKLADIFLNQMENESDLLLTTCPSFCGRNIELSMEAALAHAIITFSREDHLKFVPRSFGDGNKSSYDSGVSLPAAVVLFDLSILNAVPRIFLVHIASFVARALDVDSCSTGEDLPRELTLGLAFSVLETAGKLYTQLAEDVQPEKSHESDCKMPLNSVLQSCLKGFQNVGCGNNKSSGLNLEVTFEDTEFGKPNAAYCDRCDNLQGLSMDEKKKKSSIGTFNILQELMEKGRQVAGQENCAARSEGAAACHHCAWRDDTISRLSSLHNYPESILKITDSDCILKVVTLHLISASLLRMIKEAYKQVCVSQALATNKFEYVSGQGGGQVAERDWTYLFDVVREAFKFCLPKDVKPRYSILKLNRATGELLYGAGEVVGHALFYFAEKLCFELQFGAREILCKAYLHVLKSLLILLLYEDKRICSQTTLHRAASEDLQSTSAIHNNAQTYLNALHELLFRDESHLNVRKDTVEEQSYPQDCQNPGLTRQEQSDLQFEVPTENVRTEEAVSVSVKAWLQGSEPSSLSTEKSVKDQLMEENICLAACMETSKTCRSSTLTILKEYKNTRIQFFTKQPLSACRSNRAQQHAENECKIQSSSDCFPLDQGCVFVNQPKDQHGSGKNIFIEEMLRKQGKNNSESFEDLKDFVVCKEGRNYCEWLNRRQKWRQKQHNKSYWKRLRAKKDLMALLSLEKASFACPGFDTHSSSFV